MSDVRISGRGRVDGSTLHIGRLSVAPDMQGKGIGTRLIEVLELRRRRRWTGSRCSRDT